jgi:Putative zinc-finger
MCNVSEKLIFWLDRELPDNEADGIEFHVQSCAECRTLLEAYKEVGRALDAYCRPESTSSAPRTLQRWSPALAGVAAAIALLLIFPRGGTIDRLPLQTSMVSPVALETPPVALNTAMPNHAYSNDVPPNGVPRNKKSAARHVAPRPSLAAVWAPPAPAVQVVIPAAAMFPPGAVPEGVSLTAEFTIAADGSAQGLRLRQ